MPSSLGYIAILLQVSVLAASALAPSGAIAQERCSGTFCDLYYGNSAPTQGQQPAAKAAAPTPITVPTGGVLGFFSGGNTAPAGAGAPAASRPMVGVGGGGLAAMARGEPTERCTGTFCDLFYGGAPATASAEPVTAGLEGVPASARSQPALAGPAAAEPAPEAADPDLAEPAAQPRRATARVEPSNCVATAQDPWRCYR